MTATALTAWCASPILYRAISDTLTPLAMTPTVTAIIPNYNHAPYLRQRIDSVLAQTLDSIELIILDDCSTDHSRRVIEEYRDHPKVSHIVYNDRNSGSTFAQWQKGLALARGKYVWIAESDDYAEPEFLSTLVPLLEANPKAVMAFSGSNMVDARGDSIKGMDWDRYKPGFPEVHTYTGRELITGKLLWTCGVYNASMVLFRRDTAPAIEPRQLTMRYCGDWLFWVNTALRGEAVEVRRKLNYFRQHAAKVSPGASRQGLYFTEGLPVMARVADALSLSPIQRAMLAGRAWKRLVKFPALMESRGEEVTALLEQLSPGASRKRLRLSALYEADKYLNFTHLQP